MKIYEEKFLNTIYIFENHNSYTLTFKKVDIIVFETYGFCLNKRHLFFIDVSLILDISRDPSLSHFYCKLY